MRSLDNSWQRKMYMDVMSLENLAPTPVIGDNTACLALIKAGVTKRGRGDFKATVSVCS